MVRRLAVPIAAALALALAALPAAAGDGEGPKAEPPKKEGETPSGAAGGTKTADLLEMLKSKDAAIREAAAKEAARDADPAVTVPLARLLVDPVAEVRLAAIGSLGARADDAAKRTAAAALADRLRSLGEKGGSDERLALAGALHDLAQPPSVKVLMDGIKTGTPIEEVEARLRAVGNVPAKEAVEALIDFAASCGRGKRGDWHAAVRTALKYALRTDVRSADPDLWRAWWRENERTFDFARAAKEREEERAAAAEKERKRKEGADRAGKRKKKGGDGDGDDGGKKDAE
jgi:hypothetical protein